VSVALGHRIRWTLVVLLVLGWFVALAMNTGGNGIHLLLVGAVGVLLYELVAVGAPS